MRNLRSFASPRVTGIGIRNRSAVQPRPGAVQNVLQTYLRKSAWTICDRSTGFNGFAQSLRAVLTFASSKHGYLSRRGNVQPAKACPRTGF